MITHLKKCISIFAVILISPLLANKPLSFVVIVHKSNPVSSLSVDKLSDIFLKKEKKWLNGEAILPVDLTEDSEIRDQFSEMIHDKRVSKIKAFWQKQIFSGRGVPPPEKNSDKEIIEYISDKPGAIGYVSAQFQLKSADVKIIEITMD